MTQKLHYLNLGGMLIRGEDGMLDWKCPDCGAFGQSKKVRKTCPKCKNRKKP